MSGPDGDREAGFRSVSAYRVSGESLVAEQCLVVGEDALNIDVEGIGTYTLMWTPTEPRDEASGYSREDGVLAEADNPEALALAAGFCFTEGLISGLEDIRSIAACPDTPGVIRMQLVDPLLVNPRRRNVTINSSCGICGGREAIDNGLLNLSTVPDRLRVRGAQLSRLMAKMHQRQSVFQQTGGSHAAAVFSGEGEILAVAEDLGRHNALDKVIGTCILQKMDLNACGVLLSSRMSFEMVVKAVRAKFEMVAAISAPTMLAIEIAERYGVTLCGFVRDERVTVYTHPRRLQAGAPTTVGE